MLINLAELTVARQPMIYTWFPITSVLPDILSNHNLNERGCKYSTYLKAENSFVEYFQPKNKHLI